MTICPPPELSEYGQRVIAEWRAGLRAEYAEILAGMKSEPIDRQGDPII